MLTKSWIQKYVTFTVMQKVPWPVLVNRIKGNSISILEDPFGTWKKKQNKTHHRHILFYGTLLYSAS